MQYAGTALAVKPAGHLGRGTWTAALALALAGGAAEALAEGTTAAALAPGAALDVAAAVPVSFLSHARRPRRHRRAGAVRMVREHTAPALASSDWVTCQAALRGGSVSASRSKAGGRSSC